MNHIVPNHFLSKTKIISSKNVQQSLDISDFNTKYFNQ